jgi:hypothetical protein
VGRGERPIKLRDSWFSPKCIYVQRRVFHSGGRATGWPMGPTRLLTSAKLRMPVSESVAVRLRGISFVVERETAQTTS